MLRRRFLSGLTVAGVSASARAQDETPIRVDVNLVNLPFSVRDSRGQLVQTLTKDDIEILEDGQLQRVTHFSRASESVLSLALVADASGSQHDFLKEHRKHLRDFLKNVMQPRDQALLLCFGNNLRLAAPFTNAYATVTERLEQFQKGKMVSELPMVGPREIRGGGTAFYDAIYHSADNLLAKADAGRRAMLIFSDGEDNSSAHHMLDAIEAAQRTGTTLFCLRYTELRNGRWTARNKYGRSVMDRLAQETGGLAFDAGETDNLKDAYRQIADILRASYDVGYPSSNRERDGSFRKIQIRAKQGGLTFRHKTGYFAR